jgi:pantoate--beta-alanine ligase
MKTISCIGEMKSLINKLKAQGKQIGFVPTMGFLHEGHLSLVRESVKKTDKTVVSIFVNPTQFSPSEDFEQYPRDQERDSGLLEKEDVDYLFIPDEKDIYPTGFNTYVEVVDLQKVLCGVSRPHFFRGVCTVVLKLFNIVDPDLSFFGQKDAQQAIILKRMVLDLNMDVKIEVLPIIRDEDGLALSSRNYYLSPEQRKAALSLSKSLQAARGRINEGEKDSKKLIHRIKEIIRAEPLAKIDYVEIVDMEKLDPLDRIDRDCLIALAVFIDKVRLIDNTIIRI